MTKNLTEGAPGPLIWNFTIPLIFGNIFQQLYAFVDTLIVGRWLGVKALAAVGCTGCLMFFLIGFILGTTNGFALVTGQRFGANDAAGVRKSAASCVISSLFLAVAVTAFALAIIPWGLAVMETPPEIYDDALGFITIVAAGMPLFIAFALQANMIRVLGDSRTATIMLATSLIFNIAFEPLFILWLDMGVRGAAYATIAAQAVSAVACFIHILRNVPALHARGEDWRVTWRDIYAHLRLGLPMGLQMTIVAMGQIVIQIALNRLGPIAVASYAAAQKVESIAVMPMISFGLAMAAFSAQNFGAGKPQRITQGIFSSIKMSGGFSLAVGILMVTCGHLLIEIFVEGESAAEVIEYGQTYLGINGFCYFILSLLFIFRNTLAGLGQMVMPTFGGVMELIMRSICAFVLCETYGFLGACWASPLAWLGAMLPMAAAYYYTQKKWPRQQMAGI